MEPGDIGVIVVVNLIVNYICFLVYLCGRAIVDANKVGKTNDKQKIRMEHENQNRY